MQADPGREFQNCTTSVMKALSLVLVGPASTHGSTTKKAPLTILMAKLVVHDGEHGPSGPLVLNNTGFYR